MLFLWFYHACRRGAPRFLMVSDHVNYLTFEDPGAVHTVRRALKLAEAGDLHGAAETAGVEVGHAAVVSQGLRRGMRFSIGAEMDNDPRARPDAQNIVDAMRPDGMIRTVHFLTIEHPDKGADWQWPFDDAEFAQFYETIGLDRVWELYMTKLLEDIEKLPGQIAGNFYAPVLLGHWPDEAKLAADEDRLLEACAKRGMAVEINTRPLYRDNPPEFKERYLAAIARLAQKAHRRGVPIAVGSGAHSPKDQGAAFDRVLKILDAAQINEIVFPVGGRLARVALRATKEHLQKVKAQEPAPQPGSSISGFSRAELGLPERDEAAEAREAALSKTGHDSGPRKRASASTRTTKKPAKAPAREPARSAGGEAAKSAKPPAKAGPKTAAKAPPKAPSKAPAKPIAKSAAKPPVKPVAKPPAKAKPLAKPPAKAPVKAKPVAKPTPKTKAPAKPAVKAKAPAKPAAKKKAPARKAPAKPARKAPAKPARKAAPVKKAKPAAPAKKLAKTAAPAKKKAKKPSGKRR